MWCGFETEENKKMIVYIDMSISRPKRVTTKVVEETPHVIVRERLLKVDSAATSPLGRELEKFRPQPHI